MSSDVKGLLRSYIVNRDNVRKFRASARLYEALTIIEESGCQLIRLEWDKNTITLKLSDGNIHTFELDPKDDYVTAICHLSIACNYICKKGTTNA